MVWIMRLLVHFTKSDKLPRENIRSAGTSASFSAGSLHGKCAWLEKRDLGIGLSFLCRKSSACPKLQGSQCGFPEAEMNCLLQVSSKSKVSGCSWKKIFRIVTAIYMHWEYVRWFFWQKVLYARLDSLKFSLHFKKAHFSVCALL